MRIALNLKHTKATLQRDESAKHLVHSFSCYQTATRCRAVPYKSPTKPYAKLQKSHAFIKVKNT